MQKMFSSTHLLATLLSVCSVLVISSCFAQTLPNGIAAGDTSQTATVLWTRSTALGELTFEYSTDPTFTNVEAALAATVLDPTVPVKVEVTGLTPGTQYYYKVTDNAGSSLAGQFRTAAVAGVREGIRFGVSGDWDGYWRPFTSVGNVAGRDLDFFVALGDTVYADLPSPVGGAAQTLPEFRAKHAEVYEDVHLQALRASTSLWATIDDHEVVDDFAGGASPASDPRFDNTGAFVNETELYSSGLQAFQEYNPVRDEFYGDVGDTRVNGKQKLYRTQDYGSDASVYVLDARSFRDTKLPDPDLLDIPSSIAAAFDPSRTMLGRAQLEDLKQDLLQDQLSGSLWKIVMIPEPIQYLGPITNFGDRYEGYAAERAELLAFIDDNDIENVVFISADIHSTFVNDLSYQLGPGQPEIRLGSFEISTAAVAYDPPTGFDVVASLFDLGLIGQEDYDTYIGMTVQEKDLYLQQLLDALQPFLGALGYYPLNLLGLDDSVLNAELLEGTWTAAHSWGWTEFDIDAVTGLLEVTTYGVGPYGEDPSSPIVLQRFVVQPVPELSSLRLAAVGMVAFAAIGWRRMATRKLAAE